MKYFLFVLLLTAYSVLADSNFDPNARNNPNRHVYSYAINDQVYSPVRFFNNNLRYRIDEHIGQVTVNIGARALTVNTAPLIRYAANLWNRRLRSAQIPIQLTEITQSSPSEVDCWISRANDAQEEYLVPPPSVTDPSHPLTNRYLAYTTLVLPDEMLSHYSVKNFTNPGIVIANTFYFSEEVFTALRALISSKYSEQDIANVIVYFTMVHEFGHTLGLTHPILQHRRIETHGGPLNTDRGDVMSAALTAQLPRGVPDAGIPIMTSNLSYFRTLATRLNRRIVYRDITPTELELAAISMENSCGGSPPSQSKRNVVSSESCKEKPRVFYPIAQSLVPIYQTQ
ncbi:hypothetical protein [Xenorhabdus sp. KJ12.1]|uniref:hypothetical protein n=1 Tax=Xenorhabdus sp. KJ12.1 TaxID=1851571 RepID=UPI000C04FD28|nr:hypothetical protein [Xenorhabdus sp. KJ12.1]PHM66732.1 hypothetical protein Xekj_04042 [Xenorhabdus sp. KJ12.1]